MDEQCIVVMGGRSHCVQSPSNPTITTHTSTSTSTSATTTTATMSALLSTGWDAVNRYRKLEEATAPRDDPAPVYLLDEIADMARQSPEAAQALADALQKKLGTKNPVVKFKALRVIKHLCTKGCSQFQRCMQRHSSCVRELVHWRGEPDPFKGDVPNARVREFAKEVVEAVFNATPVTTHNPNTLAAQGKIQGFGSAGPERAGGSSQYGGIGSSGIGSSGAGGGSSYSWQGGLPTSLPTSLAGAQRAASQLTQAASQALGEGPLGQGLANALGGFMQPAGYSGRLNDSSYSDQPSPESSYAAASAYAAPHMSQAAASQVMGGEEGLVDDITTPGGLRPLPDAADLRRFVDTASGMDGLRVAELLREKMESPRWQVVLRALAALEAVLQRGSSQACGEVAVMFQSDPGPVRGALASPQPQVQRLAAAVLKHLTGEEVPVAAAALQGKKGGAAAAAAPPVRDLLIDDSDDQPGSSGAAAAVPAAAAAAGGIDDLLGSLVEPAAAAPAAAVAPAPAPAAADSLFDGLGLEGGSSSNGAGGQDMFGGLSVAPAAAPAPAAAAPATQQVPAAAFAGGSKTSAPLDELFSGLNTGGHSSNPGMAAAGGGGGSSSSSLLTSLSQPQPLLQQQQQFQQQQRPAAAGAAGDLLGSELGLTGSKLQQPAAPFVGLQSNGLQQQQHQQQQQFGLAPGFGMAAAPAGGQLAAGHAGSFVAGAGGTTPSFSSLSGGGGGSSNGRSGSGSGSGLLHKAGSNNAAAWSGHDDVSNLMRQVAHGGRYDPAFDFVGDEFKGGSSGKR